VAIRVKAVRILDTSATTEIIPTTDVLGMNVDKLNVEVELDGPAASLPAEIPIEVRVIEPVLHRADMSSMTAMKGPLKSTARREPPAPIYTAFGIDLSSFTELSKSPDTLLEVATVVRDEGTSAGKFRSALVNNGWAWRGAAKQAAAGKVGSTGDMTKEEPDAATLMLAGGVELLEVSVPASTGFASGPQARGRAFIRSPADVFFYSGHAAWWDCSLLREDPAHYSSGYEKWMTPDKLLTSWRTPKPPTVSPRDLDVLIINGCAVLGTAGPNCPRLWEALLDGKGGPLVAILGYRDTAPMDEDLGNQVAEEMARAMIGLRDKFKDYPRKWMEINRKYESTWTAAAISTEGFFFINAKTAAASHTHGARDLPGFNKAVPEGTVVGPVSAAPVP
jgi:hypothetical protein